MSVAVTEIKPKISAEEMERRRKSILAGIRTNAIEGARHGPEVESILGDYIYGEIDIDEMDLRIKEVWKKRAAR